VNKLEEQILTLLQQMNEKLDDHSLILGALRNGQESLKAELSEMRLQNAKEFGEIKAQIKNHEDSIEILKEESWNNRRSILRVQKTLGFA
jgi:predicted hydrocarbon binding protein